MKKYFVEKKDSDFNEIICADSINEALNEVDYEVEIIYAIYPNKEN